jgi:hypothetical protein
MTPARRCSYTAGDLCPDCKRFRNAIPRPTDSLPPGVWVRDRVGGPLRFVEDQYEVGVKVVGILSGIDQKMTAHADAQRRWSERTVCEACGCLLMSPQEPCPTGCDGTEILKQLG